MATAHRGSGAPQAQTRELDPAALLEQVLAKSQTKQYQIVSDALDRRIQKVEELLPDHMKGQGARLVKRALLTFGKNDKLQKCSPASFILCVLQAAECGLAIDGKLAHAVPYSGEAQFQPDYKGLIAVAKRTGQIIDIYGDVICENDTFVHGRSGDGCRLEHTFDITKPRGKTVGAYQIIVLPGGRWRYEVMGIEELNRIQRKSKSGGSGPWGTDPDEMRKKTVAKRALKLYCDDPGLLKTLEYDDLDYGDDGEHAQRHGKVGRSTLNDTLNIPVAAKPSAFETPEPQPQWPAKDDDPFAGEQGPQDAYDGSDADPEPEAAQPPAASHGAIAGILRGCKSRKELDDNWTTFLNAQSDGYEIPLELEALYSERREILPADKGGKQKSLVE